jgi:hypothetical protein
LLVVSLVLRSELVQMPALLTHRAALVILLIQQPEHALFSLATVFSLAILRFGGAGVAALTIFSVCYQSGQGLPGPLQ